MRLVFVSVSSSLSFSLTHFSLSKCLFALTQCLSLNNMLNCICSSKSYFRLRDLNQCIVSTFFFLSFFHKLFALKERESMICWSENFTLYSNADGIDFTDISGFDIFGHKINLYSKYTPSMVFGQSLYQFPMI